MKIVVKNVGEQAKVMEIKNELKPIQQIVEGYIEILPLSDGILMVCNEEGKLKDLPVNFELNINGHTDFIVGNVLFVGRNDMDFDSLSDEQIKVLYDVGLFD